MKIILATGGTGGHLFPALEAAKVLREEGHEIYFLGSFGLGADPIKGNGFAFRDLNARGLNSWRVNHIFSFGIRMARAALRSFWYLKRMKPDVVAGFGGYGAFPVVLAAVVLRYPALIHEQNVVPGRANKTLAPFAGKVAVSFKQSERYFNKAKTVLTGCPARCSKDNLNRSEIFKDLDLKEGKITILVFGGSQGSHRINEEFLKAADLLKKDLDFQVIHIAGRRDYLSLRGEYLKLGIPFALFDFFERMERAYTAADIVISRAGASTVTEIAMFQKPALLIPYPYAKGHQRENALALAQTKSARVLEEKDLTPGRMKEEILSLFKISRDILKISENSDSIYIPDAAKRLASEIAALPEEKRDRRLQRLQKV